MDQSGIRPPSSCTSARVVAGQDTGHVFPRDHLDLAARVGRRQAPGAREERGKPQGDGAVAVGKAEASRGFPSQPGFDGRRRGRATLADTREAENEADAEEDPLEPRGAALQGRAVGEDGEEPEEGRAEETSQHRAVGPGEPEPPAVQPGEAVREARGGGQAEEEQGEEPGVAVLEAIEEDRERDGK